MRSQFAQLGVAAGVGIGPHPFAGDSVKEGARLAGDLQALDGAIQSNGIVRVWNIAESYPASALQLPADSKRFDTAFTDLWVDLRITDERCEVGQAHVAASYLPFEVLRRRFSGVYLDVMPADTQGDLGIARLFPSVPLPRNCLYVYQFRHIYDDLRLARFDGSPVWTYNDSELFRDLESEAIEEAMNERLGASDRSAPDSVIKSLGQEFNRSERGAAAVELPTLAALARLANTTTPLPAKYFQELPKRLAAIGQKPLGDESKKLRDQIVAFREKEGRLILNEERRRQVCVCQWALALYLLEMGAVYDVFPDRPVNHPNNVPLDRATGKSRLKMLCNRSIASLADRSRRSTLLFVWALAPAWDHLMSFGVDYGEDTKARHDSWKELHTALNSAIYARVAPHDLGDPDDLDSIPDLIELLEEGLRESTVGAYPEDSIERKRMFTFPDINDESLKRICNEVQSTLTRMEERLEEMQKDLPPSGDGDEKREKPKKGKSSKKEDKKPSRSEVRITQIASLLGTPIGWTRSRFGPAGTNSASAS